METNISNSSQKTKKSNELAFTMEDVRNIIKQKQEQKEQSEINNLVELKQDMLTTRANNGTQQKVKAASITDILGFNPNTMKRTDTRDKDPSEVPAKYRKYYKMLLQLKRELKDGLNKLTKKTECNPDPEIASFDSGFALSLLSSEQELLTEIEQAIQRIHNNTYGICEETGNPIEQKRLEAVPFTRYSLEGQQIQEQKHSIQEQNNGLIFASEQNDDIDGFSDYEEE